MNARWIRLGPIDADEFGVAVTRLAAAQRADAEPILAWAQPEGRFLFALVAPRRLAPGRAMRWPSWGVAPAIAACRHLGMRAYLDGAAIWLHGERISAVTVREIRACVVVDAGLPAWLPSALVEDALRRRIEAQHGWQFDNSWPSEAERAVHALA